MEKYTDTQLLRAYDVLQDIKMFLSLNESQREGIKTAQAVLMEKIGERLRAENAGDKISEES